MFRDRDAGVAIHWDGAGWSATELPAAGSGTSFAVDGVWGDGASLWAVGGEGSIVRWDGVWRAVASPTDHHLFAVRGTGDDAWAVGAAGTIVHAQ